MWRAVATLSMRVTMTEQNKPNKPNNLRTALMLAALAFVFFIGIFAKRFWFS